MSPGQIAMVTSRYQPTFLERNPWRNFLPYICSFHKNILSKQVC